MLIKDVAIFVVVIGAEDVSSGFISFIGEFSLPPFAKKVISDIENEKTYEKRFCTTCSGTGLVRCSGCAGNGYLLRPN